MTEDARDLAMMADILCKCSRYRESLDAMNKVIEIDPVLSLEDYELFKTIYKNAVDVRRDTLRTLNDYITANTSIELTDRINTLRNEEFTALKLLCDECLETLDTKLIPNAKDSCSIVFYKKLSGDFARYICEFADADVLDSAMKKADKAYKEAIDVAVRDLKPTDSARLAAILNYAVFQYEQCNQPEKAKELLTSAIEATGDDVEKLSEQSRAAALDIISVMETNLENWSLAEDEE